MPLRNNLNTNIRDKSMLEVLGAGKSFKHQIIFKGFNLSVEPGRFKVLVGPSGCGKTTFFDGLTGVTTLDEGQISWKGKQVSHLGNHAAYMQQKDLLLPWFTLMENAMLPAKTGSTSKKQQKDLDRAQAEQLFIRLGLDGYEAHFPNQVSGGMRQRCALVRTLMFNRELILLDEPLSALDAITRQGLQSLLLMLQSEFKKTILMITHDIEEALLLGDEICLLTPMPMETQEKFIPGPPKPRKFNDPELITIKAHVLDQLKGDLNHGAA